MTLGDKFDITSCQRVYASHISVEDSPSPSTSYTKNMKYSFSSLSARLLNAARSRANSRKFTLSNSRTSLCARGLMDSSGMPRNSSALMYPLRPRSRERKRLYRDSTSACDPAMGQKNITAYKPFLGTVYHICCAGHDCAALTSVPNTLQSTS